MRGNEGWEWVIRDWRPRTMREVPYRPLPLTVFCFLPTAHRLPPTAFCLLPSALCPSPLFPRTAVPLPRCDCFRLFFTTWSCCRSPSCLSRCCMACRMACSFCSGTCFPTGRRSYCKTSGIPFLKNRSGRSALSHVTFTLTYAT